ncbi:MAG: NADP-reducing hydrogenase subunit HndA [Syntrophomonadaceae bacterium]|nr:NADP-reducing hydrogenase subunit HndA [Bacillota bacterium]
MAAGCACQTTEEKSLPYAQLDEVIAKYRGEAAAIIAILQDVQELIGYIPKQSIAYMAEKLHVSPAKIYGIVTFYAQFRLAPVGRFNLMVCEGTACHVNGAKSLTRAISDELNIAGGETTEDGMFTLERVACVGCCSLAPVIVVDGEAYANMTPAQVRRLIGQLREKEQSAGEAQIAKEEL